MARSSSSFSDFGDVIVSLVLENEGFVATVDNMVDEWSANNLQSVVREELSAITSRAYDIEKSIDGLTFAHNKTSEAIEFLKYDVVGANLQCLEYLDRLERLEKMVKDHRRRTNYFLWACLVSLILFAGTLVKIQL